MNYIKFFESFEFEKSFEEDIKNFATNVVDDLTLDRLDSKLVWMHNKNGQYTHPVTGDSLDRQGNLTRSHTSLVPFMNYNYYNGALQYMSRMTEGGIFIKIEFLLKREFYIKNKNLVVDNIEEFKNRLYDNFSNNDNVEISTSSNSDKDDSFIQAFLFAVNFNT